MSSITKYVRYTSAGSTSYGILEGDSVHELQGSIFASPARTGKTLRLADVKLLAPCEPMNIVAVGQNYKSHLGDRPVRPVPGLFWKPASCVIATGEEIVFPEGATNVHYEAELVLVIGKRARNVSKEDVAQHIFGITAGNDVSERDWQRGADKDVQWWRAKGCDTFSPLGPIVVTGIDYANLHLQTRVNGEIVQDQSTADLIFDCPTVVSFMSRYLTLEQGDVVYTGTPGQTRAMKPGDTVEIEIERIGVLRNPVIADSAVR